MRDNPLVSVIVLMYNKFDYFKECIDSVLNQEYDNIEIIISDDGSSNFDEHVFENYILQSKKEISNVIVTGNQINVGTVKNFNKALQLSTGQYIIPLALDDILYDCNTISDIVKFFQSTKCMIFTAYREVYDEEMKNIITKLPQSKVVNLIENADSSKLYKKLCMGNFISGACTPFSRKFIEKYGYFDEEYVLLEDFPKYLSVLRQGCKIHFFRRNTIKYRSGGISENVSPNTLLCHDNEMTIKKEILPFKKHTGIFIHRLNKFQLCQNELITDKNKCRKIYRYLAYIDIVIYKIVRRFIKKVKDTIK